MAESVLHFGAVRLRVQGTGNLHIAFEGLDDTNNYVATVLPMHAAPGNEPTRLTNCKAQRARLFLETDQINEQFNINRIIVYVKPLWADIPTIE